MQREPCKEPPPWFTALKPSYDSLSCYVAKGLCWKQCCVHSATRASMQCLRRTEAISNTSLPFLLVHTESYIGEQRGYEGVCVFSVHLCVFNRDTKRGESLKEEVQASFYIEEFPVRWVSAFLPLKRLRVEDQGTLNVRCVCERCFSRQVPDLLLRCRVGLI